MRVTVDLGFSHVLIVAVVGVVVPVFGFVLRRKWRRSVEWSEEVQRRQFFAAEEAARVENEAAYLYGVVSVPRSNQCALCFCPTTRRCSRCKAVHYCSGKCQIIHWRQGHKEECQPPSTTHQTADLVSDLGKKVAEQEYHGIHDEKSQIKSSVYETCSEKPPLSDISFPPEISCGKDDNIRIESLAEGNITDSNSELSSNSFSGFSVSISGSESSDDSSACESIISNKHERSEGHTFADPAVNISDTTSNDNSMCVPVSLTPKFASLVDSVDGFSTMHKLKQVGPGFSKEENKLTSNSSSCLSMQKGPALDPSTVSSEFLDKTLDLEGTKDDAKSDPFQSHTDDALPKSAGNRSTSENEGMDSSVCADASSFHNLQSVGSNVSNHVVNNPSSTLKSAEIRCLPHAFAETKVAYRTEGHSHYSTKCGNNSIQSGTATSSQGANCSNSKNGLKPSVLKVVDQFRGSNLSKHLPLSVGGDIAGRCSDKGLFPYDLFVKLYNWNKVELRPCGLINCGNSCYANAVLQCLAFTPPLTAYFLQGLHSKSCANKNRCFTCAFESLILKSKDPKSPLSPMGILSQLQNTGSQLGNGREEDAHEFLRHAIETMQSVCLKESDVNVSDSLKEETNLMGLTFGGYLRSKIKCMKCGGKSGHQERMMDLTVEIEGEIETLEEALQRFTSTEILDGENKYHCFRCNSYEKAKKKLTVSEAPNVLTIALKRFQSGKFGKLNKPIRFPEILDLAPFMSGTGDRSPIYRLCGAVVHLDVMNDAFSGHYVCYVKNFQNKWFKVDDSVVTAVELERVLTTGAYMLFYARCSPRAPRLIRNQIVSSDSKSKVNGKTLAMKSRYASRDSVAARCTTRLISPDGSPALETHYSKFHHRKSILEDDSSSDNSSLFSNNSDEGSCSTDSTHESTSNDDFVDYIYGHSGHGCGSNMLRNSDSDATLSSSPLKTHLLHSDMDAYDSVLPHADGLRPPFTGPRIEIDGLLYRGKPVDVERRVGVSHLHPDTPGEHRKIDKNSSSGRFRETESLQRVESNHIHNLNSGVSSRKSRERTDGKFY